MYFQAIFIFRMISMLFRHPCTLPFYYNIVAIYSKQIQCVPYNTKRSPFNIIQISISD